MAMIARLLFSSLHYALPIAVGAWLGPRLGVLPALGAITAVALVLALLGAQLLRTSAIGKITWRNTAAGWLLPKGWWLGSRQLPGMVMSSVAFTLLAAAIGAAADGNIWLMIAWALNGVVLSYALGAFRQHASGSSGRRTTGRLVAVIVLLVVAGLAVQLLGYPRLAALVAGGPVTVVGGLYGGWLLMIVTMGRNARWN
jgi:hypothetical protein